MAKTKENVAQDVATATGLTKKQAREAVTAVLESVQEELAKGGEVKFIGFGTFKTKERAERAGRNPQTGETITLPAKTVPFFKAGRNLKEAVK